MSGPVRIALFAVLLALVFGGAAVAGAALDPDPGGDGADSGEGHGDDRMKAEDDGHDAAHVEKPSLPTGLALADGGLRLELDQRRLVAGRRKDLSFRILGAKGNALRAFDVEHDRRMHLIVVRRDLTGFQHLHPRMSSDGTWRTPIELRDGGSYRVYADFSSGGDSHTLGGDVQVPGPFEPRELPHASDRAAADGGYEVRLTESAGDARFSVYSGGRRVTDVEPYLGARGHLVALREGDLAYLHVHPESEATKGGDIRFRVEYPSDGRYRLFLQFKHDGKVRTAAFTQEVGLEHGH